VSRNKTFEMNSKNVLAARLLASLHHEMCVSASAAPPTFNAIGMSTRANDGVITSAGLRVVHCPNIGASVLHSAMVGFLLTLLDFPDVKFFAAHKPWTFFGTDEHLMLKNVEHDDIQGIGCLACHMKVSCHFVAQ
jgi:hypothetical protein